ncbi:UNVERIFIED_CONTAM: hypothetical protein FKN15_064686 [Acipenser sinensis]
MSDKVSEDDIWEYKSIRKPPKRVEHNTKKLKEKAKLDECPDSLHCSSTIPNHYKRYTHFLLAQSRATGDQDCCSFNSSQETLASASTCHTQNIDPNSTGDSPTSQQENTAGSKPNKLLLLRSPASAEIKKSKRKPRQRKRKATSSIGDSAEQEALTPKEKGSRPRRRGWCKGGSAKEPENGDAPATRRCPFYKNIPAIADVLGCKVCVSWDKYNIMCCLESERIKELITMHWDATQLHVLPMMQVSYKELKDVFQGDYRDYLISLTQWYFDLGINASIFPFLMVPLGVESRGMQNGIKLCT